MIESTYSCKVKEGQSQKSKKVKNPARCRILALYQAKVSAPVGFQGQPALACHMALFTRRRAGSCKLGAGAGSSKFNKLGSRELNVKRRLKEMHVH